mgnify:CR=1 FL=1
MIGSLFLVEAEDLASAQVSVGAGEVLYELSQLASGQGREAQAGELLETAFATAAKHDAEAERFIRVLLAKEEIELALRVVDMRLEIVEEDASKAHNLAKRADLLMNHLDRAKEALDTLTDALRLMPDDEALHVSTRELARSQDETDCYVACLRELLDGARLEFAERRGQLHPGKGVGSGEHQARRRGPTWTRGIAWRMSVPNNGRHHR